MYWTLWPVQPFSLCMQQVQYLTSESFEGIVDFNLCVPDIRSSVVDVLNVLLGKTSAKTNWNQKGVIIYTFKVYCMQTPSMHC